MVSLKRNCSLRVNRDLCSKSNTILYYQRVRHCAAACADFFPLKRFYQCNSWELNFLASSILYAPSIYSFIINNFVTRSWWIVEWIATILYIKLICRTVGGLKKSWQAGFNLGSAKIAKDGSRARGSFRPLAGRLVSCIIRDRWRTFARSRQREGAHGRNWNGVRRKEHS